jgi:predicted NAD/FAD-dependent oxidoreductase
MAHVMIIGAGLGGVPCADVLKALGIMSLKRTGS